MRYETLSFCTVPYFEFVEIIPAIEDGYVEYESSFVKVSKNLLTFVLTRKHLVVSLKYPTK